MSRPIPGPFIEIITQARDARLTPLFWTTRLLNIAGCHFEDVDCSTAIGSHAEEANGEEETKEMTTRLAKKFADPPHPIVRATALQDLLNSDGRWECDEEKPPILSIDRYMYWLFPSVFSLSQGPRQVLIAHMEYKYILLDRKRRLQDRYIKCGRGPRKAVFENYEARVKQTTPQNWAHDPYILSTLLGLAQHEKAGDTRTGGYRARMILNNCSEEEHIHVYTCHIEPKLLEALRHPLAATHPLTWPTIKHIKVPALPYDTLLPRLLLALGVDGFDKIDRTEAKD